jgi:CRISPR-associated exonuclease Cas4
MLQTEIPAGALYHGKSRHRQPVTFDATLRKRTQTRARQLHELIGAGRTPPPVHGPKCRFCSLANRCDPTLPASRSAREYVACEVRELLRE